MKNNEDSYKNTLLELLFIRRTPNVPRKEQMTWSIGFYAVVIGIIGAAYFVIFT